MGRPNRHAQIQSWELELISKVARRFSTTEREELEAELARRLLHLKRHLPRGIRDWKAYLAKFLFNKSANWVRDQRAREKRKLSLVETREEMFDEIGLGGAVLVSSKPDDDLRTAFSDVWKELDPELRLLWEVLLEERGNQTRVAQRLGKHRNTVRLWLRRIRETLAYHGF